MESDRPTIVKIIVIGEADAGKARLIERFAANTFTSPDPYIIDRDFVIFTQSVRLHAAYQGLELQIWDAAGQERFRALTYPFYKNSKGVVIVYDITNRASYDQVSTWANSFRRWVADAAAVLVGTKLDLAEKREVSYDEGVQAAERLGVPFLETSAKTAINVDQVFYTLLELIGPNMGFSGNVGFERDRKFTH